VWSSVDHRHEITVQSRVPTPAEYSGGGGKGKEWNGEWRIVNGERKAMTSTTGNEDYPLPETATPAAQLRGRVFQ
jgi:hypothetical protein